MTISSVCLPKPLLLILLTFTQPWLTGVRGLQGDSWCGTLMCVKAIVDSSTVTYELKSLNQLGWMSIGFGSQMANTPLVILWQTANGTVTLSQRQASGRVEPLPVTHPARQARVSSPLNSSPGNVSATLAFNVPKNNDTLQSLIWAFSVTTPDPDPSADIEQHLDAGALTLDLTKKLDTAGEDPLGASISQSGDPSSVPTASSLPASPQPPPLGSNVSDHTSNLLVLHAVLSAAGFLILLPLGTLVARWARVFTPRWFTAHWLINVVLGIPLVCLGGALGPLSVAQRDGEHIVNAHQICGVLLFVLYIIEVALGTLVHLRRAKDGVSHPPRNVVHVILGLGIFALSIYETINGVERDPSVAGAGRSVVFAICIGWSTAFAGTYSIGLLFLRKQFAQERLGWNVPSLPLPMHTPGLGASLSSSSSDSVRQRANVDDGPMADDGTHDIYSRPEELDGSPRTRSSEMRQVQTAPVSLSAFL